MIAAVPPVLRFYKNHARRFWRESRTADPKRLRVDHRLRDIARGFHPLEADWYRQLHGSTSGFISNLHREEHLRLVNRHYGYLLDNKVLFAHVMSALDLPTPAVFASFHKGSWSWIGDGRKALDDVLAAGGRFVIKPTLGKKGEAVRICRSASDMAKQRGVDAIATAFVTQADYAAKIFPKSLNTIRVLMLRDGGGQAFLAAATHRFGTLASAPVDNFSSNGIVANVHRASGRLEHAIALGEGNQVQKLCHHPETGAAIAGTQVQDWPAVQGLVERLGAAFPYLIYVGWDIAMTPDGPIVIEGNSHPSLRFFQFYGHLLDDPALNGFFARFLPHLRKGRPSR